MTSSTSPLDIPQTNAALVPTFAFQISERYANQGERSLLNLGADFGLGTYTQTRPSAHLALQLRTLQGQYTIVDTDLVIIDFLSEQRSLYPILMEAVKPLHQAFGERRVLQLRTQFTGEESMLRAVAQLPVDFDDPEGALRSFDEAWWLKNCHRSAGALVFEYEIQDAV